MRVVLKGIHKVKARLAAGELKTYYYAWRGGPQIKAKPGTPEFVREWREAHASVRQPRAGIAGRTFHDLRGTAVVRLAIAGATVPRIAGVTGHSLRDVEAILDAHYLGRDIQLAEAAVLKLEARTKL
ncbi:hypothetical protein UP10_13990 [Bradyrhizobium sp. LTSPM299]|uniref:hypothetical protein n=1 Tax=Bradyrhizobium sp. LTSPM299 TaxID=1619233 RepID=UPI0005CA3E12|nr:hypothetical protein UP10_13990 [Bradyrhizobium sp. LTSPM299]